MTVLPSRRSGAVATRPSWRWLFVAVALALPTRPASAEDLEWHPLNAIYTTTRTAIEVAVTRESVGLFDFADPGRIQVAFAELDEHPGHGPSARRSEVILRRAPEACTLYDCPVMILTWGQVSYVGVTVLKGPALALGTGFKHGLRNLVVNGDRLWFTGREYRDTEQIEGWRVLTDLDPLDRGWIEEECRIGVEIVPGENPPAADNVFVALVELDQNRGSTSQPHPEIVVMDRNPLSCGSAGCSFSVYAVGSEGRRRIGGFQGSKLSFGAGYHNGMRDVILDAAGLFTFDGAEYGWARRLLEVPH